MIYEKSDRVQRTEYGCPVCFMQDVIETLFDEDSDVDQVNIIADTYLTEVILKTICRVQIDDFEFDLDFIDFNTSDDNIDEYKITIFDDGDVYIEPAINKDAEYYDCDGFMFVEADVSDDAYNGNNRHCDVMVFTIENENV